MQTAALDQQLSGCTRTFSTRMRQLKKLFIDISCGAAVGSYAGFFFSGQYNVTTKPVVEPPLPAVPLTLFLQYYCQTPNGTFTSALYPRANYDADDFIRDFSRAGRTGPQNFSSLDIS